MALVDLTTLLGASDAAAQLSAAATFVIGITLSFFAFKTIKGAFSKGA